jgi:hypothetical protein
MIITFHKKALFSGIRNKQPAPTHKIRPAPIHPTLTRPMRIGLGEWASARDPRTLTMAKSAQSPTVMTFHTALTRPANLPAQATLDILGGEEEE